MLQIAPLPTPYVTAMREGAPDIHAQPAERAISSGKGTPCRHCLEIIREGKEMLILAARPFPNLHPYAEAGPIFLCADTCTAWSGGPDTLPEILTVSPTYLMKAYDARDRIIFGSGQITPQAEIATYATALLDRPEVAYVHVRSATNNCYLARISRAEM